MDEQIVEYMREAYEAGQLFGTYVSFEEWMTADEDN